MEIDILGLLQGSDVLLLFTVLGLGLLLGRVRLGSFDVGSTAGVLLVALVFGNWGLDFTVQTESLGFMLFIFLCGDRGGPKFLQYLRPGRRALYCYRNGGGSNRGTG